jgi:hypothetical protein
MAATNISGGGTTFNDFNYLGLLYEIGQNMTPFLNSIGGLQNWRQAASQEFAIDAEYRLQTAGQPSISETQSITAPTPTDYVLSQNTNCVQIFQEAINLTYARVSDTKLLAGLPVADQNNLAVTDPLAFQKATALRQVAVNAEYTFLNGTYNNPRLSPSGGADPGPYQTRGILPAIQTNVVAAEGAELTKGLMDQLLRTMAAAGAHFVDPVVHANAWLVNQLSNIYGYAPFKDNVGGVRVETILTDFCQLHVVYSPKMPVDTIGIFDISLCAPVVLPVPGKGFLFYEDLAKTGATERGQIYGQIGLQYGPEMWHGKITGLATS